MNRKLKIFFLLFFFALCGAAVIATYNSSRHTPAPAARELFAAVNRQLSALSADDFGSAYRHAASVVQQKFSLPQFESMIRRDFSSMTQARRVEFGAVQVADAGALVQVFLTTPDGVVHGYLYSFTAEHDGWKIDGVQPLETQPTRHLRGLHV
ncbi:MAG TPA: DUF4864 domain-containing protein [Chthoniobacterales bacterium]|jgi:hypothetical protein|nr:DUF4864 domain-containing protein [Chthoniobacterales bacterium]